SSFAISSKDFPARRSSSARSSRSRRSNTSADVLLTRDILPQGCAAELRSHRRHRPILVDEHAEPILERDAQVSGIARTAPTPAIDDAARRVERERCSEPRVLTWAELAELPLSTCDAQTVIDALKLEVHEFSSLG